MPSRSIFHAGLATKGSIHNREEKFRLFFWSWAQASGISGMAGLSGQFENTCTSGIGSLSGIAKDLGLSLRTVEGRLRKFRTRIEKSSGVYTDQLSGVVHVDAWTYRPRLTKHPARRPPLLGMMSNDGQLRVFVISRRRQTEIYPLIHTHVAEGTRVLTNGSRLYTGLKDQGFPDLIQKPSDQNLRDHFKLEGAPSLFDFWKIIEDDIHFARGVPANQFLPRVREAEFRWRFRNSSLIDLYRHALALMVP